MVDRVALGESVQIIKGKNAGSIGRIVELKRGGWISVLLTNGATIATQGRASVRLMSGVSMDPMESWRKVQKAKYKIPRAPLRETSNGQEVQTAKDAAGQAESQRQQDAMLRHQRTMLDQMAKFKQDMERLKRQHQEQRMQAERKRAEMEEIQRKLNETRREREHYDSIARAAEEELESQRKKILERERLRAQQLRERARQERLQREKQAQFRTSASTKSSQYTHTHTDFSSKHRSQYTHTHSEFPSKHRFRSQHKADAYPSKTPFPSSVPGPPPQHHFPHFKKSAPKFSTTKTKLPQQKKFTSTTPGHHKANRNRLASARHFQILELDPSATTPEVKGAYRRLARTVHPDKNISASPRTQEIQTSKFLQVKEAYEALKDATSRRKYMDLVAQGQAK